ncbi:hypothetical protein D3C73_1224360 [compost metagenome]
MVPAALISFSTRHMSRRISMSTPAVGSSRISRRGRVIIARAIISRRFMPPDRVRLITCAFSHRWARLSSTSAICSASARGTP